MRTKNYFWSLLTLTMATVMSASFASCGDDEEEVIETNDASEVRVHFVYTLDTSNGSSMTRSSGDNVFNAFYEKIVSGEMALSMLFESSAGV